MMLGQVGSQVIFGGSLAAAVVAGVIALLAPCCISVMLPAYFASSFQNRYRQVAMTFVYGAGVATVVLPIAFGAVLVRRLLFGQHGLVFGVAGGLLVGLGLYTLAGGSIHLPMPGGRRPTKAGPLGVYSLGIVSGLATSCCAPVLASVVALSGLASSFLVALALGSAYVFGMVAPLFIISLAWQRFEPRFSVLFRPRSVSWHLGRFRRSISGTALVSGLLLLAIGGFTLWTAVSGSNMAPTRGWEASLTGELGHLGHIATDLLSNVPTWALAIVLVASLVWLGRRAARELGWIGIGPGRDAGGAEPFEHSRSATVGPEELPVSPTSPEEPDSLEHTKP